MEFQKEEHEDPSQKGGYVIFDPRSGSLVEQAYRNIFNLIYSGELGAGQSISHRELAERCGMSKMPIAAACKQFEQEGIILARPRRGGSSIAVITFDDIWEALQYRLAVEQRAAVLACNFATAEDLATLLRLAEVADHRRDPERPERPGDPENIDYDFHLAMLRCSHSQLLIRQAETIRIYSMKLKLCPALQPLITRYPDTFKNGRFRPKDSHLRLYRKIAARKPMPAARAVEIHICDALGTPDMDRELQTARLFDRERIAAAGRTEEKPRGRISIHSPRGREFFLVDKHR